MKDNKTWTLVVIVVFLHTHRHEQSSLPNLLNLKNQPIETIQSTHKSPLSNPQTTGILFKSSTTISDKCNFYMIFIILLFIKIVSFPLFLLI